jgi:hypothetical protein
MNRRQFLRRTALVTAGGWLAGCQTRAPQRVSANEWLEACRTGARTACGFDYAGALTEAVLLGNVAYRTGHRLEWEAPLLRVKNSRQASNYLQMEPRRGWELC